MLTTSFEDGPNGPIVPELKDMFPDAPYVARPGQINAWDNDEFVAAVKAIPRPATVFVASGERMLRLVCRDAAEAAELLVLDLR